MTWSGPSFTAVELPDVSRRIRYADHIVMLGSCFAEHMTAKLLRYKYQVHDNPFGILYNPVSLAESIRRIRDKKHYTADDLVFDGGLYHSMDHHGVFSGRESERVLDHINHGIDEAHICLGNTHYLFVSPGTAWVYRYRPTGAIAGNCHKIPQSRFERFRLSVEECVRALDLLLEDIRTLAPQAIVIWTVSPVRHLRDGLIANQKSKATLILAIDHVMQMHPDTGYFPAYEIMTDQLRDYRYYKKDLTHPSAEAIDILWELFCGTYIDKTEFAFHRVIEKIRQSMEHRFLHHDQVAINHFAEGQLKQIEQLQTQLPGLSWNIEKAYFEKMIITP